MSNKIDELFKSDLVVLNVGPKVFGDAVRAQGAQVIQVDWKPVAAGDPEMLDILEALGGI